MELRPAGLLGGGFVLPDAEIRPSGVENVAGVVSFAEDPKEVREMLAREWEQVEKRAR